MQNMAASKHGTKQTWQNDYPFFCSKTYLWMRKYNIVVIGFSSNFENEMCYLVPLSVHEKEKCLKEIQVEFWCFIEVLKIFLLMFS